MFCRHYAQRVLLWLAWATLAGAAAAEFKQGGSDVSFLLPPWTTEKGLPSNTVRSIRAQVRTIYAKLHARSLAEAVAKFIQPGNG